MKSSNRWKLSSLALLPLLILSACTAAPPGKCEPMPKAEAPQELLVPPSIEVLKNFYKMLGVPWEQPDEKQKATTPDTKDSSSSK